MTQKASGMPTIQRPVAEVEAAVEASPEVVAATKPIELKSTEILIVAVQVPYVLFENPKDSHLNETRRCDLGRLSQDHARKLRAIRRGYDLSGVQTADGHEVDSLANAVKALLDSVEI